MPAPDTVLSGDDMLAAVTDAMVELHHQGLGGHGRALVVALFISNHHVGPDTEIELFLLEP